MLHELIHNGVIIPKPPEYHQLTLTIRGQAVTLTPKQEEMAMAWSRKQGTPYVEDAVFIRNFLSDFSKELGIQPPLKIDEIDFTPAINIVEAERQAKAKLTKEERKILAAERKAQREALKQKYGYAIVNGERVELGNYLVEPSGIFMGRGKHPLRGRWKEGAQQRDVVLNLSPNAPMPEGEWQRVWEPENMWVARWKDKLSGKMKYIWLHDSAPLKQAREASKFDKAHELHEKIAVVRQRIEQDLINPNDKIRKIATACYLIDALCLRVGDEKDPDEADTVGATTLRPEHIKFHDNGLVEFKFLGKDSVLWHKKKQLPPAVIKNLKELSQNAQPSNSRYNNHKKSANRDKLQLFSGISSRDVNAYLSEIMTGLTAKVFRTHHATIAVKESLAAAKITASAPEYEKWQAVALANLEAAILCNHTKKVPSNWSQRKQKQQERQKKVEQVVAKYRQQISELIKTRTELKTEAKNKITSVPQGNKREKVKAQYDKKLERTERMIKTAQHKLERAQFALSKLKAKASIATKNRAWNLGTSLKSYIEPRVYYQWGKKVNYDVLEDYYPATLRRKFTWVRNGDQEQEEEPNPQEV